MVRRYRKAYIEKFGAESLSETNNFGALFPSKYRSTPSLPTWWEFVQYLKSFSKFTTMDPHWRPVYVFCTPCSFTFKYMLKFEHLKVSNTKHGNLCY